MVFMDNSSFISANFWVYNVFFGLIWFWGVKEDDIELIAFKIVFVIF